MNNKDYYQSNMEEKRKALKTTMNYMKDSMSNKLDFINNMYTYIDRMDEEILDLVYESIASAEALDHEALSIILG